MARPRDSYRARVYAAENAEYMKAHGGWRMDAVNDNYPELRDRVGLEQFIYSVCRNPEVRRVYPRAERVLQGHLTIGLGQGARRAFVTWSVGADAGKITLPVWARKQEVILHELAHVFTTCHDNASHGREFVQCQIFLYGEILGVDRAEALELELWALKVPVKPKRKRAPLSEERRAQLAANLAKARQAKQQKATEERLVWLNYLTAGAEKSKVTA